MPVAAASSPKLQPALLAQRADRSSEHEQIVSLTIVHRDEMLASWADDNCLRRFGDHVS